MGSSSSVSSTSLGPGGRRIPPPVSQRVIPRPETTETDARSNGFGRLEPVNSLAQLQADPILASVVRIFLSLSLCWRCKLISLLCRCSLSTSVRF